MTIPLMIVDSWRHCGLKVRGCWSDKLLGHGQEHFRSLSYWLFVVVESGSLSCQVATEQIRCQTGEAMLLAPKTASRWRLSPQTQAAHILFSPLPAASWRPPWHYLRLPAVSGFVDQAEMEQLLHLHDGKQNWTTATAPMEARFLFDRILWTFVAAGLQAGSIQTTPLRPGWLDDLVKAVSAACGDQAFGVTEMVRLAGCSHAHLCRSLRRSDDLTPAQLLRFLRVNKASHLISHTPNISTAELVERCGFANERRLQRQFKDQTGMTLTLARSSCQQE